MVLRSSTLLLRCAQLAAVVQRLGQTSQELIEEYTVSFLARVRTQFAFVLVVPRSWSYGVACGSTMCVGGAGAARKRALALKASLSGCAGGPLGSLSCNLRPL